MTAQIGGMRRIVNTVMPLVTLITIGANFGCVPSYPLVEEVSRGEFPDHEQLDRSYPCQDEGETDCGYPSPGESEVYGYGQGQVIEIFPAYDCEGNELSFEEFLSKRPDNGLLNKGIILSLGAGWCAPCMAEAALFAESAFARRDDQIEFLHVLYVLYVLYEDAGSSSMTPEFCETWYSHPDITNSAYPVVYIDKIDSLRFLGGETSAFLSCS